MDNHEHVESLVHHSPTKLPYSKIEIRFVGSTKCFPDAQVLPLPAIEGTTRAVFRSSRDGDRFFLSRQFSASEGNERWANEPESAKLIGYDVFCVSTQVASREAAPALSFLVEDMLKRFGQCRPGSVGPR